jgi:hypothetical protein
MLSCVGFEAQNGTQQEMSGKVECRTSASDERFLFCKDFAPLGGMSGGPFHTPLPGGVHVAGIVIHAAASNLIGLSLTAPLLTKLRSLI